MTLKSEIKNAYIEKGHPVYINTHSDAVYVDENETETLTERLYNVKESITKHTTQLNAITQNIENKANKENSEFIGTMKLNGNNVVTEETNFKHKVSVVDPGGKDYVDINFDTKIDGFVVAQNGNISITQLYVKGIFLDSNTNSVRVNLSEARTGSIQLNIIYR